MSNHSPCHLAAALLTLSALVGCATQAPPPPQPPPSAAQPPAPQPTPARPFEVPEPAPLEPARPLSPLDDPNSPLYKKVVYFDYDTAEIPAASTELLRAHAGYIYRTPGVSVRLEGHTDERGTRDYNLALGERRAVAVQRFLVAEGAPADRLRRLSYGEERPAASASSERAWAQNRRVQLVY